MAYKTDVITKNDKAIARRNARAREEAAKKAAEMKKAKKKSNSFAEQEGEGYSKGGAVNKKPASSRLLGPLTSAENAEWDSYMKRLKASNAKDDRRKSLKKAQSSGKIAKGKRPTAYAKGGPVMKSKKSKKPRGSGCAARTKRTKKY